MSLSALSLHRFLYVSDLAPAMPSNVVGQILRQSREHNGALKVNGSLLFDGERFCQLLEAESTIVLPLMSKIERDPRHCRLNIILRDTVSGPRLMTLWQCGYCEHGAFDAIEAAAAIDPDRAVTAFMHLLKISELST